jgi:hypothetical protein
MMLIPAELAAPFQHMLWFGARRRSMIPEDLTEGDIALLADLVPEVRHAALRARLADRSTTRFWCFVPRLTPWMHIYVMLCDDFLWGHI